MENAEMDVKW